MPFEFISNNGLNNDATRTRIRSHAARGKNKGNRISRQSRKDALAPTTTSFRIPLILRGTSEAKEKIYDIERPIDDGLLFPGLLPGESKGLVKKAISFMNSIRYSSELNIGLDYGDLGPPICVKYMFSDEACFHSSMATALHCLDNLIIEPEGKLQAMRHVSHMLRLVNQNLHGQSAINDFTIAAVINMAQYEHHQRQFQQGSIHMQGLWQIAQLRGGVSNLIRSPSGLGQKMLRIDLEYSFQLGTPTLFSLEEAELGCKTETQFPSVYLRSDHEVQSLDPGQSLLKPLSTNYRHLFGDFIFLASLLNSAIAGDSPKMNAIELHQSIILLGYRLVRLNPLGLVPGTSSLQNKAHLGLAAFLVSFLQGWDGRIAQNELLSQLLLAEVQSPSSSGQHEKETLLWLLFIGAGSSCLSRYSIWVSRTQDTLQALKIESWGDVRRILAGFPWVNAVHDAEGQALWYASNSKVHSL